MYNLYSEEGIDQDALFFVLNVGRNEEPSQWELALALDEGFREDERQDYHLVDETEDDKNGYTVKHITNGKHSMDLVVEHKPESKKEQKSRIKIALKACHEQLGMLRKLKSTAKSMAERRDLFVQMKDVRLEIKEYRHQLKLA